MKMRRWRRVVCAIGLAWQAAVVAQPRALEPGVEWLPGRFVPGEPPDGNSVLIDAPDGWIVVDSGRYAAHAQALLDRIRASGKPLRAIVNTHWHLDHVGGNRVLLTAYPQTPVIASDAIVAARSGFLANYRRQLLVELAGPADDAKREGWRREIELIDDTAASTPSIVIRKRDTVALAGLGLSTGVEANAVTAGDVWVYEPNSVVLVAGDLVTLPAPLFDTACPTGWAAALQRISTIRFRWLVPGHGEPMSRGQFVIYRESFDRLLQCAASTAPASQCVDGWLRDAGGLFTRDQQPLARALLASHFESRLRSGDRTCAP